MGFPVGSVVKNLPINEGGMGLIPELKKCPGEGNGILRCVQLFVIPWAVTGYSVHVIFQARILEWVAIFYFRGSS